MLIAWPFTFHAITLTILNMCALNFYGRGDEEEEHRADVVDEDAERSKRYDEEVGSGSRNCVTMERSLKTGDASSSFLEKEVVNNKSAGKE